MSPSPKSPADEKKLPDNENSSNDELSHPQFHIHNEYNASTDDESTANSDDDNNNNNNNNNNNINSQYDGYCLLPQESDINQQYNNENEDEEFLRFAKNRLELTNDENKTSQTINSSTFTMESIWSNKLESETFPVDDDKANYIKNLMSSIKLPESSIPIWAQYYSEKDWQEKLQERIACRQTTFFHNEKK